MDETHSKGAEQLRKRIEEYQEQTAKGMLKFGRAGTYSRSLITSLATVTFKVIRLRRLNGSGIIACFKRST